MRLLKEKAEGLTGGVTGAEEGLESLKAGRQEKVRPFCRIARRAVSYALTLFVCFSLSLYRL